ncbi:Phosphate-repressible phosphate permease, partial [Tetrabaena socialis]
MMYDVASCAPSRGPQPLLSSKPSGTEASGPSRAQRRYAPCRFRSAAASCCPGAEATAPARAAAAKGGGIGQRRPMIAAAAAPAPAAEAPSSASAPSAAGSSGAAASSSSSAVAGWRAGLEAMVQRSTVLNALRHLSGTATMTPSRGFSAELSTSFTISLASVYGLPVSTTQCITGGEMGVGMVDNWRTGVNWKLFVKQAIAWVATLIVSGFISAALFAVGVYAPSLTMSKDITVYENTIRTLSEGLYKDLNKTNYALKSTFGTFDAKLNKTINDKLAKFKAMFNTKVIGYIDPFTLVDDLNVTLVTYKNYTVVATGFNPTTKTFIPGNTTDPLLSNNKIQVSPYDPALLK